MKKEKYLVIGTVFNFVVGIGLLCAFIAFLGTYGYYSRVLDRYPPVGVERIYPFDPGMRTIALVRYTGLSVSGCYMDQPGFVECMNKAPTNTQLMVFSEGNELRPCPKDSFKVRLESRVTGLREYYGCYRVPQPPKPEEKKDEKKEAKKEPLKKKAKKDAKKK